MRLPLTMLAVVLIIVPAHASELTGTLQKVKETNRIVLGFQEASVPFSYLDGNQKAIGYALDICMKNRGRGETRIDYKVRHCGEPFVKQWLRRVPSQGHKRHALEGRAQNRR